MSMFKQSAVENLKRYSFFALLVEAFFIALNPTVATVALIVGVLLLLCRMYADKQYKFRRTKLDVPIVIFTIFGAASVFVSPNSGFSLYNFSFLVSRYLLTYLLFVQTVESEDEIKKIIASLGAAAVIVVLYGFYQFIFGIDISEMKWVDGNVFPELKKRVFSTWENPNILAGYLGEVSCVIFAFLLKAKEKVQKGIFFIFLLASIACLAMTYTRGAFLAMMLVFFGYGVFFDKRILFACIGLVVLLLLADQTLAARMLSVFSKIDTSMEMRLAMWESTVYMIADHPFFGIGWGAYWLVYHSYDFYIVDPSVLIVHAHNVYLNYMAEIGIIGAGGFFAFFFGALHSAIKKVGQEQSEFLQSLRSGIVLAIIFVALYGLTDNVLFNIPTSMLFWLICAIAETSRSFAEGGDADNKKDFRDNLSKV